MMSCTGGKTGRADRADAPDSPGDTTDLEAQTDGSGMMPKAADELFDDFFFNFADNMRLQTERIAFPLSVVDGDRHALLSREQWTMDCFFIPQGYYTLLFDNEEHMEIVKDTTVRHAVVEKINLDAETVKQYVFDRVNGIWMMTMVQTIPFSQKFNATFLSFYRQFASDKAFQRTHLARTVRYVGPDPDEDFSQVEGEIMPDTWEAFAPELPSKMIYNIIYGQPRKEGNSMIFVMRGIANGQELQMTFRRKGGTWRLTKLTT